MKYGIFLVLVMLVSIQPVSAKTWFVEKDGSGDFTTLQPAADAAASGDTIRVGPGRFNEAHEPSCIVIAAMVRLVASQDKLTLIGAGSDKTMIGPEDPYQHSQGAQVGVLSVSGCGSSSLKIRGICFENLLHGVHAEFGNLINIEDCFFRENYHGLAANVRSVVVRNCRAEYSLPSSDFIVTYMGSIVETFVVEDCEIEGKMGNGKAFGSSATQAMKISNCIFHGGYSGIAIGGNGDNSITDCVFSNQVTHAVKINSGVVNINRCNISGADVGIFQPNYQDGILRVKEVVFSDMGNASYLYAGFPSGYMHDCILDKGAEFVVGTFGNWKEEEQESPRKSWSLESEIESTLVSDSYKIEPDEKVDYHFDMRGNWWGTTDPDSIMAWVEDGEDLEDWPYFIDWSPFEGGPVSVNKEGLGYFKTMFRGVAK